VSEASPRVEEEQRYAEGKGQAGGQPLPVVAEGLIPLIYRRAFFKHRATP
jgi:hypothetical protein